MGDNFGGWSPVDFWEAAQPVRWVNPDEVEAARLRLRLIGSYRRDRAETGDLLDLYANQIGRVVGSWVLDTNQRGFEEHTTGTMLPAAVAVNALADRLASEQESRWAALRRDHRAEVRAGRSGWHRMLPAPRESDPKTILSTRMAAVNREAGLPARSSELLAQEVRDYAAERTAERGTTIASGAMGAVALDTLRPQVMIERWVALGNPIGLYGIQQPES